LPTIGDLFFFFLRLTAFITSARLLDSGEEEELDEESSTIIWVGISQAMVIFKLSDSESWSGLYRLPRPLLVG
jgi:hypothetical protein